MLSCDSEPYVSMDSGGGHGRACADAYVVYFSTFCPYCYSVLKLRNGSVALAVRLHYQSAHSLPRKCTYEGCRRRWTKNVIPGTWCFKHDARTNELLLDRVRCEEHSMKCAVDRCKNRWFEGLPDSQGWNVGRNADGSVKVKELKCPNHA